MTTVFARQHTYSIVAGSRTVRPTWFALTLSEGVVNVNEGEVIAVRVLEPPVTLEHLVGHAGRWLQEAAWR